MPATDRDPLLVQEIAQHPAAREGEFEMEFVHPPHDGEIGRRHRPGQVVDAAAADPERLGLLGDRQIVIAVDHRFALSRPALPSAPDKKSLASVSSPILACSVFTSMAGAAVPPRLRTEHPGSPVQKLSLPGRDLVRMHVELLGQLGQRLLAPHGSQGHLRLEGRGVVPARSLAHRLSCPRPSWPPSGRNSTHPPCPDSPSHLSP